MTDQLHQIITSADGQWAAIRRGREVELLAGGAPPAVGQLTLDSDDIELALVGPPSVLVAVSREGSGGKLVLYQTPSLEAVARLDLEAPMRLAAVTGPRLALVSLDAKQLTVVRVAARALASQVLVVEGPIEFAIGLDKHQLLLGLLRKLEVWDGVSGRPLRRMQLQLPPPPRAVGAAQGHVWATVPGSPEILVYRLSDGRPFKHHAGAPIEDVICHPSSPVLVLVTARGLVRLHCFAHALSHIDAPWRPGLPLAQLPVGEDVQLLGLEPGAAAPWRIAISAASAPAPDAADEAPDKLRAMRERGEPASEAPRPRGRADWREPLAAFGAELVRGVEAELPTVAVDTELGDLAHRCRLGPVARRALIALYSLHLVGEPALSIARLAHLLGDWIEALGNGDLGALAMLRREHGKVALHAAATDLCDGATPRAIRLLGVAATAPRPGAYRVARDGRSDAELETDLAAQLGRIAMVEGSPHVALLEARLHQATAVALVMLAERPRPWPRDASLVLVPHTAPSSWIADLPSLQPHDVG